MYSIASISLFILVSAQLPRSLNLILDNNLVLFEYFSFWQWAELKVCKFDIDCWFLLLFLSDFYFILCMFCIFVGINFVYFLCQELWLFYVHFVFIFFSSNIFNFTDVLLYYVLANQQFQYPTSLQWVMLSQWLWITVCYVEPLVVNHCVFCWASCCEPLWAMLSQWSWITCAILSHWLWIIVSFAEPVAVNHCELSWASGYELLWVMLSQWLWITVCYIEPLVWNHCEFCWASGCEPLWAMLRQMFQ